MTDYLRARSAEVVVRAMEEEAKRNMFEMGLLDTEPTDDEFGDPPFGAGLSALGRVDATGMDDDSLLPELIAVIRRAPTSRRLVKQTLVWPISPAPGPDGPADDDAWAGGPWVWEFDVGVRDTLAGVHDTEIPEVAARWGRSEAVRKYEAQADVLLNLVERLRRFAREARENDERLYCLTSL
ncbi:hypothetical protein [Actinomadura sp. K4S16]|uniref:hypothetical protein n=1 Tax=Actinomadura sp. K4S16 TaxID=1316147 RepID=UPI00190F9965|nr:hypothetical protein [Actinomadura sp. K4S16]